MNTSLLLSKEMFKNYTDVLTTTVPEYAKRFQIKDDYKCTSKDIPPPINGIISYWQNYPYGGAWQLWMPGYIWPEVERQMTKPSKKDDVFVAVNAFSYRSSFSNSALQVVELVMPYSSLKCRE
ncbi:aplysianin-A-like [Mytilus edulis]|uniref:aplysianin-A-like n=1 Tax=Mytilus edulis TaxID=6550 RepID=UPI0039EEFBE3